MNSLKQLKQRFLEYIEIEKGRASKTVENYDHYLSKFFEYGKITKPSEITEELVRQFRLQLNRQSAGNNRATGATLKKRTQNYYLIALRSFLKFLVAYLKSSDTFAHSSNRQNEAVRGLIPY